ncbi:hypothetical protein [Companilactobacillus furfuricola]|uniref:hypothetical protein n=1 Tax=Companilactobacillus furfuricola TaxID=1462575 RepID=UPI000F7AF7D4|nr:hypothetical protein [Companilactobacillus furfuricola]
MKFSKILAASLVSVSMLTAGVGAAAQFGEAQNVDAAASFDIPIGTVTPVSGNIRVIDNRHGQVVRLFNFVGDDPVISTTRSVQNGTWWYTDKYKTAPNENGVTTKYYRVSTNEWVSGWDVRDSEFQTGQY